MLHGLLLRVYFEKSDDYLFPTRNSPTFKSFEERVENLKVNSNDQILFLNQGMWLTLVAGFSVEDVQLCGID